MPGYIENFKQIQNRTEKEKTEKDKLFHPVSYATEHNSQVYSRWIEVHLNKKHQERTVNYSTQQNRIYQNKKLNSLCMRLREI